MEVQRGEGKEEEEEKGISRPAEPGRLLDGSGSRDITVAFTRLSCSYC